MDATGPGYEGDERPSGNAGTLVASPPPTNHRKKHPGRYASGQLEVEVRFSGPSPDEASAPPSEAGARTALGNAWACIQIITFPGLTAGRVVAGP